MVKQQLVKFKERAEVGVRDVWERYKAEIAKREEFMLDRQYLPAVVELQESPPSPTARYLLWGTVGFVFLALVWSILGSIDVVAVGQGKTVPTGRVKVIQPLETGVVKAIHVQDGQAVKAGDVLVELDVTQTEADQDRLQQELALTEADIARLQALLDEKTPVFDVSLTQADIATQEHLYAELRDQHVAEMASLRQQLLEKKNERDGAKAEFEKLRETLPLVTERADSYKRLAAKGFVARSQANQIEEQRLQTSYGLETQKSKVAESGAAIQGLVEQISATQANFRNKMLTELNEKSQKRVGLVQDLAKAEQRNRLQHLTAPISGTVQELKIHTVGGVVTPAQELMKVVPFADALEAEVLIQNKDVGFVREGQPVRVKLEAYPFTKYGVIQGRVKKLSLDAIQDEKLGLVYAARIALDKATLRVEGREMVLTAGLAVTAEVKTGTRRIIEYFLSPIMQYSDEAIRER